MVYSVIVGLNDILFSGYEVKYRKMTKVSTIQG